MMFALGLFITAGRTAYTFVRSTLPFPSVQTLYRNSHFPILSDIALLTNISQISNIVDKYKRDYNISLLHGVLAVDAISVNSVVKISEDGFVEGIANNSKISKEDVSLINSSFNAFEEYVKSHFERFTINNAFVYQFQPIDPTFPCLICHIHAATNGKASENDVAILNKISSILNQQNFITKAFAFDGDNAYNGLHDFYYRRWRKNPHKMMEAAHIISDALHVIKRARYRLLKGGVSYFL